MRIIGMSTSVISYTIVIPKLTSNVGAYGIYSVVISLLMLFQFADLGFLGAGQKYAAESFSRGDKEGEIKILSFVHFILFMVVLVLIFVLFCVYLNPDIVFNNLEQRDVSLAKRLILVFLFFSPVIIMQRFVSAVFAIRIEDYIKQAVDISVNSIIIISTFYFFNGDNYDLVGYIFFMQLMYLIAVLISTMIIKLRYKYNFALFVKSFRFNNKIFKQTKKMAITSITITGTWILYYELDSVYASKLYNVQTAAFLAIGITLLTFSRSLMNMFFGPFQVKFNQLRGLKDEKALSYWFLRLIEWSFPISIIPTIVIIILMRPLIVSWIGFDFIESIVIGRILIATLFAAFLLGPISYLAMAREKYKFLLISSITLPLFYFLIFLCLESQIGFLALPVAKLATVSINLLINLYLVKDVITESLTKILMSIDKHMIMPLFLMAVLLLALHPFWDIEIGKNTFALLKVVGIGSCCVILPMGLYYIINPYTRAFIFTKVKQLKRGYHT